MAALPFAMEESLQVLLTQLLSAMNQVELVTLSAMAWVLSAMTRVLSAMNQVLSAMNQVELVMLLTMTLLLLAMI
jgi:hypothetical protein